MKPLISIAVPNFNYARYLRSCLDSIVAQQGDDVEILISDNCSTDESWTVIESYDDPRIRRWRQKKNIGLYPNWNFLVRQARGTYFKLVQSDDWLEPGFMAAFRAGVSSLASPAAAIALGYRTYFDDLKRYDADVRPSAVLGRERFASKTRPLAAYRFLSFSMPTLSAVNLSHLQEIDGFQPEDGMRSDSIAIATILARHPEDALLALDDARAVTREHSTNDRRFYARFEVFRDELRILRAFAPLAASKIARKWLSIRSLIAHDSAGLALLMDTLARKKGRRTSFSAGLRFLTERKSLPGTVLGTVRAAIKRIRGR